MEETHKQLLDKLAEIERMAARVRVYDSDREKKVAALQEIVMEASRLRALAQAAIDRITAEEVAAFIGLPYPSAGVGGQR